MKPTIRAFCALLALVLTVSYVPFMSCRASAEAYQTDWRIAAGDLLIGRILELTGDRVVRLGNPPDWLDRVD